MTEARWREIHKRGQSGSVPRDDGFAFDPGDDEFNSSIHVMRTLKRRSLILKNVSITSAVADYSQNLRLSTGNYNFTGCSASMSKHFHPVSIALRPDYFPEPGDLNKWVTT